MERQPGRIYFLDNPYPNGHKITTFVWGGQLDEQEHLWLHFHLVSDTYNAEDDSEDTDEFVSNWKSKGAWENF